MTIKDLPAGKSATILKVGGDGALRQHFLDMGLIQGAEVTVIKYAPMGDPVELRIHSYELTIRLSDAEQIEVSEPYCIDHNGNIAWNFLSLPCFALPPAESPSTMYTSHSSGFLLLQSANFPGNVDVSSELFFLTNSLAFLAASLALDALTHFSNIAFAT